MDRHKKIQVTNTQIYVCVFLYSMKERAVTGVTWLPGVEGQRPGPPPSPCPHLFLGSHFSNKKEQNQKNNQQQRIKRNKQLKLRNKSESLLKMYTRSSGLTRGGLKWFHFWILAVDLVKSPPTTRETPQNCPITRQDGRLASPTRLVPVTSAGPQRR